MTSPACAFAHDQPVVTDCIETTACRNSHGYGHVRHMGKTVRAHRLAYAQHHDLSLADIAGQIVRHTCDNPACVNPGHLVIGTHRDNMRDMAERGRNRQPKGARNAKARLTEADAIRIRQRAAAGESHRQIAKDFGIHHSQVSRIKTGKTWGHAQ